MRVLVRVAQHRRYADPVAAHLARNIGVKILGGHYCYWLGRCTGRRGKQGQQAKDRLVERHRRHSKNLNSDSRMI
jgi:hypothetical protein